MTEHEQHYGDTPDALPPELAAALAGVDDACVTVRTPVGTALLLKVPRHEIESASGQLPIRLVHELYAHPAAPVMRLALHIYDQPRTPLAMETFINVADPEQRADDAALAEQQAIPLFFLDEELAPRLTKRISHDDEALSTGDMSSGRGASGLRRPLMACRPTSMMSAEVMEQPPRSGMLQSAPASSRFSRDGVARVTSPDAQITRYRQPPPSVSADPVRCVQLRPDRAPTVTLTHPTTLRRSPRTPTRAQPEHTTLPATPAPEPVQNGPTDPARDPDSTAIASDTATRV